MRRPNIFFLLLAAWWVLSALPTCGDEALKRRVLEEAPREWKRFRERAQNRSTVTVSKRVTGDVERITGKGTAQSRGPFKLSFGEDLAPDEQPSQDPPMRVTVLGINDQYFFQLRAASREGPYKLVQIQKLTPENTGQPPPRELFLNSWAAENDFLIVEVEALPEIFSKPYFQLRSAEYLTEGGKRYVRCVIGYDHQRKDLTIPAGKAWIPYNPFTLDLDPNNYYQIRRVTAELKQDDITYDLTTEIKEGPGVPGPSYVYESKSVNRATGEVVAMERLEYTERSFTAPPKANFYLTAFGLPEPPGFQKKGIPVFVWFVGAGLIAIVAAIFWQRSRKAVR